MAGSDPIIRVQGLSKRFGSTHAITDVTFVVGCSETIGFVGLNGAGKSTTINTLMGYLRATNGEVAIFGQPIAPETAHKVHGRIGFASGDMSMFDNLTGAQYLTFLANRYGRDCTEMRAELDALFSPVLHRPLRQLSRGNKQKIALIGAFQHSPELVILDEPSSGLDPLMQQAFIGLIRSQKERGVTVFMSSHYLGEVAEVCSRVLFMRQGQLVKDVSAAELQAANGKAITVQGSRKLVAPPGSEHVVSKRDEAGYRLTFVYKDPARKLVTWLAGQSAITDVTIQDHDVEAEFARLVGTEEESNHA